jgi:tetratricopeptide (TPR) repeat protein
MATKKPAALSTTDSNSHEVLVALVKEANQYVDEKDYGNAIIFYGKALNLAPNNAGVTMGLAIAFNCIGNAAEAIVLLDRLKASIGKLRSKESLTFRAAIWTQIGVSKQLLGQITPAVDAYQKAVKLLPTPELQLRIQQLSPLAKCSAPVQQLILQAEQLIANNNPDGAIQAYEAALQLHPDNAETLHGLAMLQRQYGKISVGLQLLQKAIVVAPDRPDFFNDAGMFFQDRGDIEQAISFHKRALKLKPDFPSALLNLGVAYKRLGKNEEALVCYEKALTLQPEFPEAHNNIGNLFRIMGRNNEARIHLQKALEIRPNYSDAVINLQEMDDEKARKEAKEVNKINELMVKKPKRVLRNKKAS